MKHFNLKNIVASLVVLGAVMPSHAAVDANKYQAVAAEIMQMEKNQQYEGAAMKSLLAANEIADQAQLDQAVESISLTVNEIQQEVITRTSSQKTGLSFFFGLFDGSASQTYNATRIITANPQEVAAFNQKQVASFQGLQRKLGAYFKQNESAIYNAKVFAAKALQLTAKADLEQIHALYPLVMKTAQRVSRIGFTGEQILRSCVTVQHAAYTNGAFVSIAGWFLSGFASDQTEYHSYEESSCQTAIRQAKVVEDQFLSVLLIMADRSLRNNSRALSLKVLQTETAPEYMTWGSPYIQK